MIEYCYYRGITDPFEGRRQLPLQSSPAAYPLRKGGLKWLYVNASAAPDREILKPENIIAGCMPPARRSEPPIP